MSDLKECEHHIKAKEYYRDMLEHDYPLLLVKYGELQAKFAYAVNSLKAIAEGNSCACKNGCAKCDAIETLEEIGEPCE